MSCRTDPKFDGEEMGCAIVLSESVVRRHSVLTSEAGHFVGGGPPYPSFVLKPCILRSSCIPEVRYDPDRRRCPLQPGLIRQVRSRKHRRAKVTMSWKPGGLLREAVELKKLEVELMEDTLLNRPDHPINLCRSFYAQASCHHFSKALRRRDGTLAIVAAMKRFQAPRPGETAVKIADLEDIGREARALSTSGVDAALVYTDSLRFGVEISELTKIARLQRVSNVDVGMPIARQDLIIDAVQIAEAAVAGATAVNIVAAAALPEIMELMNSATSMGIESIVECHTELERDFAMECGATILHLTNWDRARNKLVPGTAERLVEAVPPWVLTIGGGGLNTASDCWGLLDAGFNGVVLGTALLQTPRPRGFIAEIRSQKRHSGNIFAGDLGVPFSENTEKPKRYVRDYRLASRVGVMCGPTGKSDLNNVISKAEKDLE